MSADRTARWRPSATPTAAIAPSSAPSRHHAAMSPERSRSRRVTANGMKRTAIARVSATETERIFTSGIAGATRGPPAVGSRFREQAQLQRKLHVVSAVGNPELLLDALLVRVHRLRADEELLTDFRRGIALRYEAEHVLLALRQVLESVVFGLRRGTLREVLREHARRGWTDVHVSARHGANGVDQLAVGDALHEVAGGARFHQRDEVVVLEMHRQDEHTGAEALLHDFLRRGGAIELRHR